MWWNVSPFAAPLRRDRAHSRLTHAPAAVERDPCTVANMLSHQRCRPASSNALAPDSATPQRRTRTADLRAEAVVRLLHFNATPPAASARASPSEESYKVLVLDSFTRSLLSPLIRVGDLRRHGVTLHLLIDAERQAIPDVPAVYLVLPTEQNVQRIVQDAATSTYSEVHVNFVSHATPQVMQAMAAAAVQHRCVEKIAKVFDQYLSFVSLEPSFFSLGMPTAYADLHDPAAKDADIEACATSVVDGLLSVLATLSCVPYIKTPKGGASEHIARLLEQRLREHIERRTGLFSDAAVMAHNRPLLVLFDRNFDLATAIRHPWNYGPLVHDALGLKLNRLSVAEPGQDAGAAAKHTYEVGHDDFFWEANAHHPFPKVAAEVEVQLDAYKKAVDQINAKAAMGMDPFGDGDSSLEEATKGLMSAVTSLPELTAKKRTLDKHTNIATALLREIKDRKLDQLHNMEADLSAGKADIRAVSSALSTGVGTPEDRLRLVLLYLLTAKQLPPSQEIDALLTYLTDHADLPAVTYIRRMLTIGAVGQATNRPGAPAAGSAPPAAQGNLLSWADRTFGEGLSKVTHQVRSLISSSRPEAVPIAVGGLMDGRLPADAEQGYLVLDPRAAPGSAAGERARGPFNDAIVFMIGGGSYAEFEAVRELEGDAGKVQRRRVLYGCTEVLAGQELVSQLATLGRKMA
ncbi:unnamed protein product [Pedinophyceae sp. YPF-701]|nr:unnamed protein product [Pedinophyceae sp. YPF-701]